MKLRKILAKNKIILFQITPINEQRDVLVRIPYFDMFTLAIAFIGTCICYKVSDNVTNGVSKRRNKLERTRH